MGDGTFHFPFLPNQLPRTVITSSESQKNLVSCIRLVLIPHEFGPKSSISRFSVHISTSRIFFKQKKNAKKNSTETPKDRLRFDY